MSATVWKSAKIGLLQNVTVGELQITKMSSVIILNEISFSVFLEM